MAKYRANPVIVDAFKILQINGAESNPGKTPSYYLMIGDGLSEPRPVTATAEMTARMDPKVGDYWVIQEDGYIYLNPKEVFERKYSPIENQAHSAR